MSSYLIDTHVWLWMQAEPGRLRGETRELVDDVANELLLSAASAWEIAITYRIGKLPLPEPPVTYVPERMRRSGTTPLPIPDMALARLPASELHQKAVEAEVRRQRLSEEAAGYVAELAEVGEPSPRERARAAAVSPSPLTGSARTDATIDRMLKGCDIDPMVTQRTARRAGHLRARARTGSAVDALVVATAEPGGTVLTGDTDDLGALAAYADHVLIEII